MPNLSRGIMLEGISCAGKTSTMYALKRLFASDLNLERNLVMLGEHYTQVLNSINGELKNHEHNEHIEMLQKRVSMIEQLYELACYLGDFGRTSRGLYTVFERGFLNHIAVYEDYNDQVIVELGERFARLGIVTVLLVIPDSLLEKRIKLRDEQMKNTNTASHYEKQAELAKKQQDKMIAAINRTAVHSKMICTDSMNWDEYAKIIVEIDTPRYTPQLLEKSR